MGLFEDDWQTRNRTNTAEEYNTAIDVVEELEAYRASMLTPDKVEEMKGRIFELSVENDRLRFMKGERDG